MSRYVRSANASAVEIFEIFLGWSEGYPPRFGRGGGYPLPYT